MVDKKITIKTNTNLSDASITEIDSLIDDLISKHSENSEKMNLMALEATSLATSVKARSKGLEEQGFLGRILGNLTGKNQKISARNTADLADAQYLGQQTLNKLAENNLMTYQMTVALGDKVNRVIDDANTAKKDFLELNQRLAHFFESMRHSLEARFDSLENSIQFLEWNVLLKHEPIYKKKKYKELSRAEKIICLANQFYSLSQQQWKPKDLYYLKEAIEVVGHHSDDKVALREVYETYQEDPEILNQLLKGVHVNEPLTAVEMAPTILAFSKLAEFKTSEKHIIDTILDYVPNQTAESVSLQLTNKLLINELDRDFDKEHSFYDVVMNLVEDLCIYDAYLSAAQVKKEGERLKKQKQEKQQKLIETNKILVDKNVITSHPNFNSFISGKGLNFNSAIFKFPKRGKAKGELSITLASHNEEPIFITKMTVLDNYTKETSALRLFNSRLSIDGKAKKQRLFKMQHTDFTTQKLIETGLHNAEDFSDIKPFWALLPKISTSYPASDGVEIYFEYLTLSEINLKNIENIQEVHYGIDGRFKDVYW